MKRKIHSLELNEVPLSVVQYIIDQKPKSYLSQLQHQGRLHIFQTYASDVEPSRLYPSQTWASYFTGKPLDDHQCYWYSDPISVSDLLYSRLANSNVDVGIVGSLHSSKLGEETQSIDQFKYLIPDCFSPSSYTKPIQYQSFQQLNTMMVSRSARLTDFKSLLTTFIRHFFSILKSPSSYGLSFFALKQIIKILYRTVRSLNKEYLRVLQFPLLGSIYIDQWKQHSPSYSSIFTNHLAGNLHRYFFAFSPSSFTSTGMYSQEWILANRSMIPDSMMVFDEFVGELMKVTNAHQSQSTFIISGSMGQHANQSLDTSKKFTALITDLEQFITSFLSSEFGKDLSSSPIVVSANGTNMAPQYGFDFIDPQLSDQDKIDIASQLVLYLQTLGMKSNYDINDASLVVSSKLLDSTSPLSSADRKKLSSSGISIGAINDHHSGCHCPEGVILLIDPSPELLDSFRSEVDSNGDLNYLKVGSLIEGYLTK